MDEASTFDVLDLLVHLALLGLGMLAHFLAKWRELRRSEGTLSFMRFLRSDPAQTSFACVSGLAAAIALHYYGELTPISAMLTGYFADSAIDKIGSRSAKALR